MQQHRYKGYQVNGPDQNQSGQEDATPGELKQVDNRLELLQQVGSGSSGTAYRARLRADYNGLPRDTEVAVKLLRPELADNQRARARLFAEGQLGQSLHHSNVAEVYGVETVIHHGVKTTFLLRNFFT